MKKIIAFLFFMVPGVCFSATTYTIINIKYHHDSDLGTFVDNGTTYGYIDRVYYLIQADNETHKAVLGSFVNRESNPLSSFPNQTALKNAIRADAISKTLGASLRIELLRLAREDRQRESETSLTDKTVTPD